MAMAMVFAAGAHAAAWIPLGPPGGNVFSVVAGTGSGKLYAWSANQGRVHVYASDDNGRRWNERTAPSVGCGGYTTKLQLRGDDELFMHCGGGIVRSLDGARTWSWYTTNILDGPLALDPFVPYRAVVGPAVSAYTSDDGAHWFRLFPDLVRSPAQIEFDPRRLNRILGVGTDTSGSQYWTRFYESLDYGRSWTGFGEVVPPHGDPPPGTPGCFYQRYLAVDAAGPMYVVHDCGLYRSLTGGATWERMPAYPGGNMATIAVDATNARVIAGPSAGYSGMTALYESRDLGSTWQALPPVPTSLPIAGLATDTSVSGRGDLWIVARDGVFLHDPPTRSWLPRNGGLYAHPLATIEPTSGPGPVLTGLDGYASDVQSVDGGQTWMPFSVDGKPVDHLTRNVTDPASLFAYASVALYGSGDGGRTWRLVNARPAIGERLVIDAVPVGTQPGLVYGALGTCFMNFGICMWLADGVARSEDGGATWADASGAISGRIGVIVVSPADPKVVMAPASNAPWITRDGARSWTRAAVVGDATIVADPRDAARWYAVGAAGRLYTTTDYGASWSTLPTAGIESQSFDLLVEPRDPRILYVVGTGGEVSTSLDRGATWARVAAPSPTTALATRSARLAPDTSATIYAAGDRGALRFDVAAYQGLWWNAPAGSESGWGLNVAHQGDTIFATWFTYDPAGKAVWLAMTAVATADRRYEGTLYRTRGPAFDAIPFDPAQVVVAPAGTGTLEFADTDHGIFTYTIDGTTQSKAIVREAFGPLPTCIHGGMGDLSRAANYQDMWWRAPAGSASGWGINLAHEGDTIFATWFTYDRDGAPLWLVATAQRTGPAVWTGTLYRTSGPRFDAFDPAKVVATPVGNATLTFADGNAGLFAWTVTLGGRTSSGTEPITRQVFRPPGTVCQ